MSCEAISLAMSGFDVCEPTLDGARVATHCLYPSFESVHVYVVKEGDYFTVHDGGGAYRSAWEHGRDEKVIGHEIHKQACRHHLLDDGKSLIVRDVHSEWLRSAILAVANASAAAANAAVERAVAAADEALVSKIDRKLTGMFAPNRIARQFSMKGMSGGDRHFDFAIRGIEGYDLLINGVTSFHASYNAKYVAFSDVEIDIENRIAVREEPLRTDVQALMQRVATIVPLTALAASRVGSYGTEGITQRVRRRQKGRKVRNISSRED